MKYFPAVIFFVIPTVISVLVAFGPTFMAQSVNADVEQGLNAYKESKWEEAKKLFQESASKTGWEFVSYYNLGNVSVRQGRLGEALGYYRKAQRLNPIDRDVKHNIEFLTNQVGVRNLGETSNIIDTIRLRFLNRFTLFQGLSVFILFSGLFFAGIFYLKPFQVVQDEHSVSVGFFTWKLYLPAILTVLTLLICAVKATDDFTDRCTVVEKKAELKSGPGPLNATIFEVPEGSELTIENKANDWVQVVTNQGASGWVALNQVMVTSGKDSL